MSKLTSACLHSSLSFCRGWGRYLQLGNAAFLFGGNSLALGQDQAGDVRTPSLEQLHPLPAGGEKDGGYQQVLMSVRGVGPYGLLWVEVQRGLLLSEAHPVLVVDDAQVAGEVATLASDQACCRWEGRKQGV